MGVSRVAPILYLITRSRPLAFAVAPLMAEDKVMPHSIFALLPARHYSGEGTWLLNSALGK
jgi:hypothetical protein